MYSSLTGTIPPLAPEKIEQKCCNLKKVVGFARGFGKKIIQNL